jgi:septum site-determining protein MinC
MSDKNVNFAKQNISETNTILVQRTIRSGQTIQHDGNIVILGDVNPGGEIIAGGNIVVLGSLRGIAHAGALGNQSAIVAAFRLEPTQLRIAQHITRAPDGESWQPQLPEIARIKNGVVVIEKLYSISEKYLNFC